jgi:small multidrug resistance family-3 protein
VVVDKTEEENNLWYCWWIVHFTYGIIPTLQPAGFGRVYAAYGGFFIISSILWGIVIDKKKPDRYEITGAIVAVIEHL